MKVTLFYLVLDAKQESFENIEVHGIDK